jgi:hypothetical protein
MLDFRLKFQSRLADGKMLLFEQAFGTQGGGCHGLDAMPRHRFSGSGFSLL